MDSWTENLLSGISDSAETHDNIWKWSQTQGYTDEEMDRSQTWYDPHLMAEEANITSKKAGMSDGETGNWRRNW